MRVTVLDESDVQQAITTALDELLGVVEPGIKVSRMPDGSILPVHDPTEAIRVMWTRGDVPDVIKHFIKETCLASEKFAPGSTTLITRFVGNLFKEFRLKLDAGESYHSLAEEARRRADEIIGALAENSELPTDESIERIVRAIVDDRRLGALVIEALRLAGSECRIFIEPSPAMVTVVERVDGHSFIVDPDHSFYENGRWIRTGVKCLIVDGILESISEVDVLLQRCHDENQALVVFARGYADDVMNTFRVNKQRGTLDVLPVRIDFNLDSANVLNDLAAVAGCDVISSLKGELISTQGYDDITEVEHISCVGNIVSMTNPRTSHEVSLHMRNLQEKRDDETTEDITKILDARIRSLASASVVIRISSSSVAETIRNMQKVDIGLRTVKALLGYGILSSVTLQGMLSESDDPVGKVTRGLATDRWELPVVSIAACVRKGVSVTLSLLSVGAAVISDED